MGGKAQTSPIVPICKLVLSGRLARSVQAGRQILIWIMKYLTEKLRDGCMMGLRTGEHERLTKASACRKDKGSGMPKMTALLLLSCLGALLFAGPSCFTLTLLECASSDCWTPPSLYASSSYSPSEDASSCSLSPACSWEAALSKQGLESKPWFVSAELRVFNSLQGPWERSLTTPPPSMQFLPDPHKQVKLAVVQIWKFMQEASRSSWWYQPGMPRIFWKLEDRGRQ